MKGHTMTDTDTMTGAAFIARYGIRHRSTGGTLERDADGWEHYAWNVTLTSERTGRSFTTPYRMGTAHRDRNGTPTRPKPADVIKSLALDISSADQTWDEWAADYGYDTDSRKAHALWETCRKIREDLANLCGGERPAMFDALLNVQEA